MGWRQEVDARKKKKATKPSANGRKPAAGPAPRIEVPDRAESGIDGPGFPAAPDEPAFHGLVGELVAAIDPHTEASRVAVLVQTLVSFGSIIGRTAYFRVEADRHYCNLFAVLVGRTSKGRKGTSWGRVRDIFSQVDPEWAKTRLKSGLSSGEGLIHAVRDPTVKQEDIYDKGKVVGRDFVEVDKGESDKRILIQEAEYANVLRQTERQGNNLSSICRQAWETGTLSSMAKNAPGTATDAHISIVGHISAQELRKYMTNTECANGFGNRFLWVGVARSKLLPDGGGHLDISPFVQQLRQAKEFAVEQREMVRDDEARELWHESYPRLTAERPGILGAIIGRAEAQTMRLAMIYALLDRCFHVEVQHLKAALALWDYCERSAMYVFGRSTGNVVADRVFAFIQQSPEGRSRGDICDLFSRHETADSIDQALELLKGYELIWLDKKATKGRPLEIWREKGMKTAR